MNKHLTGRFCHKENYWGNLILYIEYTCYNLEDDIEYTYWDKATFLDLIELKIN